MWTNCILVAETVRKAVKVDLAATGRGTISRLMNQSAVYVNLVHQSAVYAGSRTRDSATAVRCATNELHSPLTTYIFVEF